MGLIAQSLGGGSLFGGPPRKPPEDEDKGNLLTNLLGDVWDITKGIGQLGGSVVTDLYRGGAEAVTGGRYTGGENRPQGQFNLDDILINLTGFDPGDPERSAETESVVISDLKQRYGPLLRGDFAEFGRQAHEHPGFLALDLLGVGSLAGKGAQAVGKASLAGRAARGSSQAATLLDLAQQAGRRTAPSILRRGLDEFAEGGEVLSPIEDIARRLLPQSEPTFVPGEGGATAVEQVIPSANPVARAMGLPFRRAMTEPLEGLEARVGRLEAMKEAGETLSFADDAWLRTVGQEVRSARAAGVERAFKPLVTERKLRNAVTRLVGSHQSEWLARREEDLQAIREITRPVVESGEDAKASGFAQNLHVPDEAFAVPTVTGGGGVRLGTATRTADPVTAYEALATAEEGTMAARVREAARPTYEALQAADDPVVADLTRRRLDSLMEPLRLEERVRGGEAVSTLERWKEDMRLLNAERWENPMIESGIRTPAQIFERSYLALRHRTGAKFDRKAGEFVGGADVVGLDDAMARAGVSAPIYFPHIDARRLSMTDWLMSRGRVGARKATADPHLKRNTAELLDKDVYVKDPVEAYSRRAARAIRAEETAKFVENVAAKFGRRVGPDDQLAPGEVVWAPDGLLRFFRSQVSLEDEIADLMQAGLSQEDALAGALRNVVYDNLEEIRGDLMFADVGMGMSLREASRDIAQATGYSPRAVASTVKKVPKAFIREEARKLGRAVPQKVVRESVGVTRKGLELYAVPKVVGDQIQAFTKWRLGRNVRLFWDGPTNVWRSMVLLGSPRWIVNNFLGNSVFLKLEGGRFRGVVAQLDKEYRAVMKTVTGIEQVPGGLYGQGSQYVEKLGSAAQTKVGQLATAAKGTRAYRAVEKVGDASRRLNALAEDAFRREAYLTALEKQQVRSGIQRAGRMFWSSKRRLQDIAERGASPQMVKEALEEANRFFGDYRNLGPIERGVIRRFAIPFWGFYKHVLKLAVSLPVEAPGRTELLAALTNVTEEMNADLGPIPEWLQGALPLGPGDEPGEERFLGTRGANPFDLVAEAARDPFRTLFRSAHPALKMGYEQATGRSALTGKQFTDPEVVKPFGSEQQFRPVRDESGNVVGMEPVSKVTPSLMEHLLQQVPQYQAVKEAVGGGAISSTASLLDVLRDRGVITDPETGEPMFPEDALSQLGELFGYNETEYDLDRFQERLSEDEERALMEYLRRSGLLPPDQAAAAQDGSIAARLSAPLF
jgi:hypothetical protein